MNRLKRSRRVLATVLGLALLSGNVAALQQDAGSLLQRHTELREQLANNQFQRPLVVASSDVSGQLKGEIYAQLEQPFAVVAPRLQSMAQWCDVLILHLNVKSCRPSSVDFVETLRINIGSKSEQPLDEAYPFDFLYQVKSNRPDFLRVRLTAANGPLGTRNYDIELQLVALDEQSSFLRLSYSYRYGLAAKAAMQGYLATIGRNKVGFSIVGNGSDGRPIYQGSTRGVVERNTMRYYLALEVYLGAVSGTAAERQEQRLNDWHSAVERYPLQLHELERDEYLAMKHKEIRLQQDPTADTPLR